MKTNSTSKNRNDVSKKKGNFKKPNLILVIGIVIFAIVSMFFTISKAKVPKYNDKISITLNSGEKVAKPTEQVEVDAKTKAYIQDVFNKTLAFLKDNYKVEVKNEKATLPKINFAKFEDPLVLGQYDMEDKVLYIKKDAMKDKESLTVATVHELLHFLSAKKGTSLSGLVEEVNYKGKVYTVGQGLTEGITQKITYEICESILPGAINHVYGSKADLYAGEIMVTKVLELSVGAGTLYGGYFTCNTTKIKDAFNKKVIDKVGNVYKENPYFALTGGMQTIVMDFKGQYEERLADTFLGVEEALIFSLDPTQFERAKSILKVEDKHLLNLLSK